MGRDYGQVSENKLNDSNTY